MDLNAARLVVQVSDCHLSADVQQHYRGVNPHENLRLLLQEIKHLKPDRILATGDLSEDGSKKSYRTLQHLFSQLRIPVLALPGNHDDAPLLARTFPGSPVRRVTVSVCGAWQIIRLNSCMPGRPEGRLDAASLVELEDLLRVNRQQPKLIALHHQPLLIGCAWIDRYPLTEASAFMRLVGQYPAVKAVMFGHVHQGFESIESGTQMLGGPSSSANCLTGVSKFTLDPAGAAGRWLKLSDDGSLQTGLIYAQDG